MKKKITFLLILLIFSSCFFVQNYYNRFKINLAFDMSIVFSNNKTHFKESLNQEQKKIVWSALNNKKIHNKFVVGELSCGFSEDVSIKINGETLEIACDKCPYIRFKNSGKYLILSDEEIDSIRELFFEYGGYFPCV